MSGRIFGVGFTPICTDLESLRVCVQNTAVLVLTSRPTSLYGRCERCRLLSIELNGVHRREVAMGTASTPRLRLWPPLLLLLALTILMLPSERYPAASFAFLGIFLVFLCWIAAGCLTRLARGVPDGFEFAVARLHNWGVPLLLLALAVILPALPHGISDHVMREQCAHGMKDVGMALRAYNDEHGRFPPNCITGEDGRRLLSWRATLLPYLDHVELYSELRLNEPWDSDFNRAVLENDNTSARAVFRCWAYNASPRNNANYVLLLPPGTECDQPVEVQDDQAATNSAAILLIETIESGIHWAEPRDFSVGDISFRVNNPDRRSISSVHRGGANVLFDDGHVEFMSNSIDPEVLRKLTRVDANGGRAGCR